MRNPNCWSTSSINFLIDNFSKYTTKELASMLQINYNTVKGKAVSLGLLRGFKSKKWEDEEIEYLKLNYDSQDINFLCKKLCRSNDSIHWKAGNLGLRKTEYDNKIEKLLNDDLEAFYWMGFILADGCFSGNYLILALSANDNAHLEKFANFIETQKITSGVTKTGYKNNAPYCRVSLANENIVPQIMNKFMINYNKTYNPPKFLEYKFTKEQILSIIIGFIDGDGCIQKTKSGYSIAITTHSAWEENLNYINNFLHDYFNVVKKNTVLLSHIKFPRMRIGSKMILSGLLDFTIQNSLPILNRKWDKIIY
jgi:hypothetical protein